MEITGTVVSLLPMQTGQGKKWSLEKAGIYFGNSWSISQKSMLVAMGRES
jgi:hypothetical protein